MAPNWALGITDSDGTSSVFQEGIVGSHFLPSGEVVGGSAEERPRGVGASWKEQILVTLALNPVRFKKMHR